MNPLNPRYKRLWCHSPRPEYVLDKDWADRWYIPARVLPLVRPGWDMIVLPGGNHQTARFTRFVCEVVGLKERQILQTSGRDYLLDHGIERELLPDLRRILSDPEWMILPYSITREFRDWTTGCACFIFGDEVGFADKYGNKGILHPAPDMSTPFGELVGECVPGINIPRGFTCRNQAELEEAWRMLSEAGATNLLLKPIFGATGEGILPVRGEADFSGYAFQMGPVVLEERLCASSSCSVQFNGAQLFGDITDQRLQDFAWEGNMVPTHLSRCVQGAVLQSAEQMLAWLGTKGLSGPGGFDFVIEDGAPYLVDMNLGRFTGAHVPKLFRDLYASRSILASWKVNPGEDVFRFWDKLVSRGIAFRPNSSSTGVFPLCYLPGMWGMLLAFGESEAELESLRKEAEECL